MIIATAYSGGVITAEGKQRNCPQKITITSNSFATASLPALQIKTQEASLRGPPGKDGGSTFPRIAGETLSALVAVYEINGTVFALDVNDDEHIDLLLGVTLTAAAQGNQLSIQRVGAMDDSGWSWSLGCVWLGAGGRLTQSPPNSGYDVLIGSASSTTHITLNIQDPIKLE